MKEGYEERIRVLEEKLKDTFKEKMMLKRELDKHSIKGKLKEQAEFAKVINSYKRSLQRVKEGSKNRVEEIKGLLEMESRHNRQLEESRKRTLDHNQYLLKKMTKIYRVEDQLLLMTERVREGIDNLHLGSAKREIKARANYAEQVVQRNQPLAKGSITRRSSVSSNQNLSGQNSNFEFDTINANFIMNTPLRDLSETKIPIGIPTGNNKKSVRTPSPRNQKSLRGTVFENQNGIQQFQSFNSDEKPTLFRYNIANSQQRHIPYQDSEANSNRFNTNPELSLSKAFNTADVKKEINSTATQGSNLQTKYLESLTHNQETLKLVEEKQKQIMYEKETNSAFQDKIRELEQQNQRLMAQLKFA